MACMRWVLPSPTPPYRHSGFWLPPGAPATAFAAACANCDLCPTTNDENLNRTLSSDGVMTGASAGDSYTPLFLYGGVGLGKTHLMHAIGHEVHDRFPRKRVVYLTSEQFTNEVISSIATARMGEFRHKYRTVDVLLIHDAHFLPSKHPTTTEFSHTFN